MGINLKALIQRVLDLLVAPRQTWRAIKGEPDRGLPLYVGYALVLAGLPLAAGLAGALAAEEGLAAACFRVALELCIAASGLFVAGLFLGKLAACGTDSALKLVAYASTPLWLALVLGIVRALLPLAALGFIGVATELAVGAEEVLGIAPARARRLGFAVSAGWFVLTSAGFFVAARLANAIFAPGPVH